MTRYFVLFFSLISTSLVAERLQVDVKATSAILIDANTGAVLYEKNSQEVGYPASTTKIATLIYALERGKADLNATVQVEGEALAMTNEQAKKKSQYKLPAYYLEVDGTSMNIHKGERLKLLDLFYGAILVSGNDVANAMAQHISGTIPKYMKSVNEYLQEIGCENTHFSNPHGLTHPDHYTTALDMAILKACLRKPPVSANRLHREICLP